MGRDGELSKLLACIEKLNPERRGTVRERIRDLFSSLSKEVHKSGDDDYISMLSNRLFDHEVRGIVLEKTLLSAILSLISNMHFDILRSVIRVIFCCDIFLGVTGKTCCLSMRAL